jgi:hypothetical protein
MGGRVRPFPILRLAPDWRAGACCACAQHRGVFREGWNAIVLAILPPWKGGPPSDRGAWVRVDHAGGVARSNGRWVA